MTRHITRHTSSWTNFIYASFAVSAFLIAGGLFFLEAELWTKGFFAMGIIMLVQSSIALTKTIRDNAEADMQDEAAAARLYRQPEE